MAFILVFDSDSSIGSVVSHILGESHTVHQEPLSTASPGTVARFSPCVVFLDADNASSEGIERLRSLAIGPGVPPVVAIVSKWNPRSIVRLVQEGACDVIPKPMRASDVREVLFRAVAREAPPDSAAVHRDCRIQEIVGVSAAMEELRSLICRVAATLSPLLISGESGVGKELVARAVHRLSPQSERIVARNCGAIPHQLFESEMFGTERGAYTGAVSREGAFESASGGTLFLDEVGELELQNQVKLLRVLDQGCYHRVGGTRERKASARIVCATNRDLRAEVQAGRFRDDLYYRLSVIEVTVPPLRDRKDDIPVLASHFARMLTDRDDSLFSGEALTRLSSYAWPGNVRELRNVVERAVVCADRTPVHAHELRLG